MKITNKKMTVIESTETFDSKVVTRYMTKKQYSNTVAPLPIFTYVENRDVHSIPDFRLITDEELGYGTIKVNFREVDVSFIYSLVTSERFKLTRYNDYEGTEDFVNHNAVIHMFLENTDENINQVYEDKWLKSTMVEIYEDIMDALKVLMLQRQDIFVNVFNVTYLEGKNKITRNMSIKNIRHVKKAKEKLRADGWNVVAISRLT